MRYLAGLFIFLALPALAQQPTPASANLAGQLAQTLSVTLAENDALKARAEALQAEIERLKKAAEKPAPEAK